MMNECNKCIKDITDAFVPLIYINQLEKLTEWKHWRIVDKRIIISYTKGPITDLINELDSQLPSFKLHTYVKRTQQKYFQDRKISIKQDEAVLQVDFAENYRLLNQNEIQSAHFSYSQVTIFTCVAWLHNCTRSFAITSDQLSHNKYDVYCFLQLIVKKLKEQNAISKLFLFSDGCASQFKNKFILSIIPFFKEKLDLTNFEWNFFATAHGKGAVDGIGAVIKRKIWQMVKAQNIVLNNAHDFFKLAKININGISILYVSSTYIKNTTAFLSERWANVKSIPGIKSNHYFSFLNENELEIALTADSAKHKIYL
ncbi:uncharacterized protein LOC125776689 [Bactrocera dorsalis]|uniref:Uncharacterized protein LOC125776689 n=1 Tax=Bactrocera dorsalis TaxID=27457 RepID=A0ABM3JAB1_BACDO|nr:uncharacterized protein LOC125776689 [Bactrocera dorsalis]XP_049306175.1 uncharacterized protein LOC125776689 [Bactrocera dorsalis]